MKVLTAMRLEEKTKKELKILAVQEDLTIGDLVKKLIDSYLTEKYKEETNEQPNS